MEQQIARIALSGVPYSADKLYSYLVPPELADACRAGVRVSVPFGRGNRRTEGFVLETLCEAADKPLKPVFTVLDEQPLLDTSLLRLAKWMKARYFCTVYDALKTILPAGIWFRYRETYRLADGVQESDLSALAAANRTDKLLLEAVTARGELERSELEELGGAQTMKRLKLLCEQGVLYSETTAIRQISDKSVRMVSLAVSAEDALAAVEPKRRSAPLRYAAVEMLCAQGTLSSSDICYYTGASLQTLRGLEKAGIVSFAKQEVLRVSRHEPVEMALPIVLNDEQQQAFDGLLPLIARREAGAALLHGVTASGKTQVYIRLIEEALAMGRTAMLLVPEIALTPQMMAKFTAYFGENVAMLHSGLQLTERYDQWKRIRRGEARVVLGTRSAVFAPLENLGLIVLDEEQEGSYQSENPPRYHTRDVAKYRCGRSNAVLVLGSATPSVETAWAVEQGSYQKALLRRRYNENALPEVLIADLRQEILNGNPGLISTPLRQELEKNLAALNARFGASADFYAKHIELYHCPGAIVLFDNMASLESLWSLLLDAATRHTPSLEPERMPHTGTQVYELLMHHSGLPAEDGPVKDMDDLIRRMTAGMAVLLLDGCKKGLVFSVQGLKSRSVEEPSGEGNLRGSREGFADLLRVNLSLLRRLIRTDTLVMETAQADCAMKTEYAICYCKDKASKTAVARVRRTLQEAKPEGLLDSCLLYTSPSPRDA